MAVDWRVYRCICGAWRYRDEACATCDLLAICHIIKSNPDLRGVMLDYMDLAEVRVLKQ